VKRADGSGRIAALEIMMRTPAIGNLIRESKTQQIGNALVTGRSLGMQKLEHHLRDLVARKIINPEEAALHAENPQEFVVARKDAPADKIPPPRTP
jgi:twitching motility protein PilT